MAGANPAVLMGIGKAISAISSIVTGISSYQQASLQSKILQQQAATERQKAIAEEEDFRRRQSRVMAARRAALGGAGIDPVAGSPLLASEDFANEVELQARRIRAGGETRATRLEQQAMLDRRSGRSALMGGVFRSGSLLLQGAGKAFS